MRQKYLGKKIRAVCKDGEYEFYSIDIAAKSLGVSRYTIMNRLKDGLWINSRWRVFSV